MTLKKISLLALVLIIAGFGVYLRVQNLKFLEEKYLVASDSYRHFRQARLIIEEGKLPDIDYARNFPEGLNLAERSTLFPKLLAAFYKGVHSIFPSVSLHYILSLYPPIAIGIALIFLFLFTHRLLGRFDALLALLLLATLPVFSQRTLAGYVDTDALIILLLFSGIYFYSLSFQQNVRTRELIFAGISGGILGILSLVWLGSGMVFLVFCASQLLISWEKNYTKEDLYRFFCWFSPILLLILGFGTSYWINFQAAFTVLALYVPLVTFCIVVAIFFLQRSPQFASFSFRFRLSVGLTASLILLCTGVLILTVYSRDFTWVEGLIQRLRYLYGKNGVMEFVGEMQPTTWQNWRKAYGIIGLTSLAGFFLVAYSFHHQHFLRSVSHASIGGIGLLMIAFVGTIPSFRIFGLLSAQSTLILLGNFCIFASLVSTAHLRHQMNSSSLTNTGKLHLLLIVWFIIAWNLASVAVRFHLFLAPIMVILTCHFFSWLLKKTMPIFSHSRTQFLLVLICLTWLILINAIDIVSFGIQIMTFGKIKTSFSGHIQFFITLFITLVLFGPILQEMLSQKAGSKVIFRTVGAIGIMLLIWINLTGLYALASVERAVIWETVKGRPYPNKITRTAGEWLKDNVSQNAVIATNWDIGSVINEISRKTTIIDEEQNFPRILEMAQDVFCGTEATALQFLQKYEVTHLMLSSNELRRLNIHSTSLQLGTEDSVVILQPGLENTPANWHFIPPNKSAIPEFQIGKVYYQQDEYSIESVSVQFAWENQLFVKTPPEIVLQRQEEKQALTIKELIIGEQSWYFPEGKINATIWCIGNVNGPIYQNYHTIYLPEAAREWFLVKLFLGEQSSHFKLVFESEASDRPQVKVWDVQSNERAREHDDGN